MHFDSDHDSDQLCLCCAKNKIRDFQLLRDNAVDLFKMYYDQNQNARGVAIVAKKKRIRKIASKSFLKRDRWKILSWHDIYFSNFTTKMMHPHRKCSCYNSLQRNAHLLQPFRVLIQAYIDRVLICFEGWTVVKCDFSATVSTEANIDIFSLRGGIYFLLHKVKLSQVGEFLLFVG